MAFTDSPQWESGSNIADFLDTFFRCRGWKIEPTSRHEERDLYLGDRWFINTDGTKISIEYKSGIQTHYTGNVFMETVSVDTKDIPGWVYTCQADNIVYACILDHKILLFKPSDLRAKIEELKQRYPPVPTKNQQNKDYNTHGCKVPLAVAETELAFKILPC